MNNMFLENVLSFRSSRACSHSVGFSLIFLEILSKEWGLIGEGGRVKIPSNLPLRTLLNLLL